MPPISSLKITELDFDTIKQNLIDYLKSQDQFKDYDFTGSSLNILLDVLAYNTHYTAFYANMIANEMFLDSAQIRNNIVSIAKHINYIPRSSRAASATISFNVNPTNNADESMILPINSPFVTTIDGSEYAFFTNKIYVSTEKTDAGNFVFENIKIYEGRLQSISYVVNTSDANQKFIIPNLNADTTTFKVTVQKSTTDTTTESYTYADNILNVSSTSKVFYIQENNDGKYEVYFGDGILGKALVDGNVISIQYLITNGPVVNGAASFDFAGSLPGTIINEETNDSTITVVSAAADGADQESIDSIKFAAPKNYETQDRAVTSKDYENILLKDYPVLKSVYVWGGEDAEPPQYGKVFVSLKSVSGREITEVEKLDIKNNIIKSKNIITIIPEIVDPEYINIKVGVTVNYDPNQTSFSDETIKTLCMSTVLNYSSNQLERFTKKFRESELIELINDIDEAILNSSIEIQLVKDITVKTTATQSHVVNFGNQIKQSKSSEISYVNSSKFSHYDKKQGEVVECYIRDNGYGKLLLKTLVDGAESDVVSDFSGTLDYETGKLSIKNITPTETGKIKFTVTPAKENVETLRNNILLIEDGDVTVNVIEEL